MLVLARVFRLILHDASDGRHFAPSFPNFDLRHFDFHVAILSHRARDARKKLKKKFCPTPLLRQRRGDVCSCLVCNRQERNKVARKRLCHLLVDFRREEFPAGKVDAQHAVSAESIELIFILCGKRGEQAIASLRLPRQLARMFDDAILLNRQVRIARVSRSIGHDISASDARVADEGCEFVDDVFHFCFFFLLLFVMLRE